MKHYKVIYQGKIVKGNDIEKVKQNLASVFRTDIARIERFFKGRPVVVKDNLTLETAKKYRTAFHKAGAVCQIEQAQSTSSPKSSVKTEKPKPPEPEKIAFKCDKCGWQRHIPAKYAGKVIKCPGCKTPVRAARRVQPLPPEKKEESAERSEHAPMKQHKKVADVRAKETIQLSESEGLDWKDAEPLASLHTSQGSLRKSIKKPSKLMLGAAIALIILLISAATFFIIFRDGHEPTSVPVESSRAKVTHPRRSEPKTVLWNAYIDVFQLDKKNRPSQYVPITSNRFQKIKNGLAIKDNATGLIWQRAGSSKYMKYKAVQKYVKKLNSDNFAGYDDWRLPTINELTSLLTKTKQNGDQHISSIFDKKQQNSWSSDRGSSGSAWVVDFSSGLVLYSVIDGNLGVSVYVRLVRAGQYVPIKKRKKNIEMPEPMLTPVNAQPKKDIKKPIALKTKAKHKDNTHDKPYLVNSLGMEFVYIPPGEFMMGSPVDEPERDSDERLHKVVLSRGFYMQTTEVTQGQWKKVTGKNPSKFKNCGDDCPVEFVSWNDVQGFIKKLNSRSEETWYRLPTEAQWEYACRAGTQTPFAVGKYLSVDQANYNVKYPSHDGKTVPVSSFKPNAWGLYDMHGNVVEWCQDWYGEFHSSKAVTDPNGPSSDAPQVLRGGKGPPSLSGPSRVLRGGSWFSSAKYCRSAYRGGLMPDYRGDSGFRLVLLSGQGKVTHPRRSEPKTVSHDDFKDVFQLDKNRRPRQYVPITSNRFQKINNGLAIKDNATGLMWQQAGSSESFNYGAAQEYVKKLNNDNFAGYNDWRLPTLDELTSQLTKTKQDGGLYISSVFDKKQRCCWSSDRVSSGPPQGLAWVVYFGDGLVYGAYLDGINNLGGIYVRVVRAGQNVPIKERKKNVEKPEPTPVPVESSRVKVTHPRRSEPKTVSKNNFKDVFQLDKNQRPKQYVPITSNRFQTIKNGLVIKDNATGLMWQQAGSSKYMKYKAAQRYVKKLNSDNFAGYNDWRLPTVDELTSLMTKTRQDGGLHISSVFDKKQQYCWSSDRGSSGLAWLVGFNLGLVSNDHFGLSYVRLARAGQ
ncbi:DUF1566 domain-containing protein [Desulfococcaceae bacterium HSG7]|nr:DUF1566 domain-containing protein [Desulfococcaceae bacterium HSG7]